MARKRKQFSVVHKELFIESIGFEGVAVARDEGIVHFIKGALPGERVVARVTSQKKSFAEGEAVEILDASADRIAPPCEHFGACGGCKWQHFRYSEQLVWKRQHVVDAFERLAKIPVGAIRSTVASPKEYGYRNKMEFSFGASRWLTSEEIDSGVDFDISRSLGLHVPGRFDKVRHINHCLIQSDFANQLLANVHTIWNEITVEPYHQRSHNGFLRNLVVRHSVSTNVLMCALITSNPVLDEHHAFVEKFMSLYDTLPTGSSLLHAVNDTKSPVAVGEIRALSGPGWFQESSHNVDYRISPFSFFQTNSYQTPNLIELTISAAELRSSMVVWDLYCGTGTLTLPLARQSNMVYGLELVESSIRDAEANAAANEIGNVVFAVSDLHNKQAIEQLQALPKPDVVVIDPPRAGMHKQVVEHLLKVLPPRIVYVSCNPTTLARDCALLHQHYDVTEVTPVDMFPHTFHVEAVATLVLRSN